MIIDSFKAGTRTRGTLEVYADKSGDWRWRAKAKNGAVIADSAEGYGRRASCLIGADRAFGADFTGAGLDHETPLAEIAVPWKLTVHSRHGAEAPNGPGTVEWIGQIR